MPTFYHDGAELYYELSGTGAPLVLICGFSGHSNDVSMMTVRRMLSESYRVLCVDNRGAGQTRINESTPVSLEIMVEDIAAVMTHVGMEWAHLLGVSMGGAIAQEFSLRYPERTLSQIIAVSLAYNPPNSRATFLLETIRLMRDMQLPQTLLTRMTAVLLLGEKEFENEALMQAWLSAPPDPLQQTRLGYEKQGKALENLDLRERLRTATVPTLVMSSYEDPLVPQHYQDEIAALIPGAQIKKYPGGHLFMALPMYGAQFLEDVKAFHAQVNAKQVKELSPGTNI